MLDLATERARHEVLKERLIAEHGDLDEETLADTLEGLTNLNQVIAAALRSALDDEAMAAALKDRLQTMRARMERITGRAKAKRRACAAAMDSCEIRRIEEEDLTVSLRPGSLKLDVEQIDDIPLEYWRTPDPVLDRREVTDALKAGTVIPGARLVEGDPIITVRTK
ncbi:hypothetical protein E5163_04145 [Marinicauda algicola]|uniref:Siphovirus Gp157 family protein n=1 Tax=Marinicauda algicola TaxID=2029849 RepID=A0A4S2H3W6_9PROT|nr:siphovirus Gp157 family protein [Marinicauda algicola]TGY90325.1 hypothetical protein E5163_04145 [Marinicauda algicola]